MYGGLFSRGQNIEVIERMSFGRLRYWNNWHEIMCEEEKPKQPEK
jgi:hypothetical protein